MFDNYEHQAHQVGINFIFIDGLMAGNRRPALWILGPKGKVARFRGEPLEGVKVNSSVFEKNGKWSSTTYDLQILDGFGAIQGAPILHGKGEAACATPDDIRANWTFFGKSVDCWKGRLFKPSNDLIAQMFPKYHGELKNGTTYLQNIPNSVGEQEVWERRLNAANEDDLPHLCSFLAQKARAEGLKVVAVHEQLNPKAREALFHSLKQRGLYLEDQTSYREQQEFLATRAKPWADEMFKDQKKFKWDTENNCLFVETQIEHLKIRCESKRGANKALATFNGKVHSWPNATRETWGRNHDGEMVSSSRQELEYKIHLSHADQLQLDCHGINLEREAK